jgi:hypothetical protein
METTIYQSSTGTFQDDSEPDRRFCSDKLDMDITVSLFLVAGHRGFSDFDISATGSVNDGWVDSEVRCGSSHRPE